MNYFIFGCRILQKLSGEFDVPIPELIQASPQKHLSGWYFFDEIHISPESLKNQFETLRVARHEFAHYLADLLNIKINELQARKFERNMLALGKLPKSQTILNQFLVGEKNHEF